MDLRIENLCVSIKGQEILKRINLTGEHGQMLALLGASGCGKSTLLKSIAGLLPTTSGEIYLGERLLNPLAPEKRKTVIVFQDLRLFPHLSVERNISFAMEIQKKSADHQKERVAHLLRSVQLEGYEKRKIREISGGQMQRVALARALASEPDILLLDEPFSGLDERLREDMGNLVRKIQKQERITTVLVTHDKSEALRLSDKISLMKSGEILQTDTPFEIFDHPKTLEVAEYFGRVNRIGDDFFRPSQILLSEGQSFEIDGIAFLGEQIELRLKKIALHDELPEEIFCTMRSNEFFEQKFAAGDRVDVRGVK